MLWLSISRPWRHSPYGCTALANLAAPAERAGVRKYLDLRRSGG
jgi:hypothetical protein